MASRSVINVKKNAPTTIEFNLDVSGVDEVKKTQTALVIENVMNGCDVCVKAKHIKDNVWSVTVPNLKNFTKESYSVRLEVVVDGYHFVPAQGKMVITDNPVVEVVSEHKIVSDDVLEEGINSGSVSMTGPEDQLNTDPLAPEFPVDNDEEGDERAHSDLIYPVGQNNDEHTDDEDLEVGDDDIDLELDATTELDDEPGTDIEDIASRVVGTEGPQLPFNVKEAADKIIKSVLPTVKMPAGSKRLLDETTKKRIMKDPETMARLEEKSRKVRDILGIK